MNALHLLILEMNALILYCDILYIFIITNDELIGEGNNDVLSGNEGADSFSCGSGRDTITDFNAAEGDTKTADCENF